MEHYAKTATTQIVLHLRGRGGAPPPPSPRLIFLSSDIEGFYSREPDINIYSDLMHVRTRIPSAQN